MAQIVVIGAGIGGLATALCAARSGHHVRLVERDDTPAPHNADEAFEWDRRGAPQVRHSHAFLARLRNLLRDRHPDVLDALFAAGVTEMDFIEMMPEGMDRTRQPGDEDLVALACRRTTFEWVLRDLVLALPETELLHGRSVQSLTVSPDSAAAPVVTGVVLDDGTVLRADVVVDSGGRRSNLPGLLSEVGVALDEEEDDTGIVYFSRFFRLLDDAEMPEQSGPIGGDLGHLRFGVFTGDNRTFSITLACGTNDDEMRRLLLDEDAFLAVAASIPATARHVEAGRSAPTTGVNVMARLVNRSRRFTGHDGAPIVLGLHAVGDAHTCTNPLYGRGCSLAVVQAQMLVDELDRHGLDHVERSVAYERDSDAQVLPWYRAAVEQDRMEQQAREAAARRRAAAGATGTASAPPEPVSFDPAALIRDGLLPAVRTDPTVFRAFIRMFNLLEPPEALMADAEVVASVMAHFAERDERPREAPLGPCRTELLELVGSVSRPRQRG